MHSEIWANLRYGHPLKPRCPDKRGSTVRAFCCQRNISLSGLPEEPVWKKINKTREQRMEKAANSRLLTGTERLEQLLPERLAPDSPLLQAVVLSKAGSVEKR